MGLFEIPKEVFVSKIATNTENVIFSLHVFECLQEWRCPEVLRDVQLFMFLSFQSQIPLASELQQFTLLQLDDDLGVFCILYLQILCLVFQTFPEIVWFLRVDSVLFTLAPVAVGQLRDRRRGEPSQKHSLQPLPATLSGTQTGPSQCCFFWKTNKVNFYGATNQKIGNQVSIEK